MRRALPVLFALVGLLAYPAQAQPAPDVISFQGRLTDTNGQPVPDGSYQLQFQLYDQPSGGNLQWSETQVVTTRQGVFTALLGAGSPLTGLPFEEGYYVALTVNGSAELGPRTALAAVPYALSAQRLEASALEAGSNVTITRQNDGALRIEAAGGGTGGLTRVSSDATLTGEGTAASPLGLSDQAVVAGQNVTVTRESDGSFVVNATGGSGGLSPVATDATLAGDGTAGSPLSLADGSVVGSKLADGALAAGSNVTITRQGNGSLEIAAAADPLSLPYTGSVSNNTNALSIENTGNGDGIHITAGNDAIEVSFAGTGLHVAQAAGSGVLINDASIGVEVANASSGFRANNTLDGIEVIIAGRNGIFILSAGQHGLFIDQATAKGIQINQAGNNGLQIGRAGSNGIQIDQAHNNGLQIDQAHNNGLQIGQTTFDGIQIQNAGRDGIRVSAAGGKAGFFGGDVQVTGTLSKGGGSFKIDHPLDPANRYLAHSFVESPDMMNVYNGNAVLDASGEAVVALPDYFEALNRDFRYQLTAIGAPGPNLYIAEKISGNRFRIAGGAPGMEVSWQVTGIRQDAWANEHRIIVEQAKPAEEQGYYLHPALFSQPRERGLLMRDTVRERR